MKRSSFLFTALLALAAVSADAAERLQAKVTGKGTPVVLIPGLNCSGSVWDATVTHLESRHECHVLTLAGFAGVAPIPGAFVEPTRDAIAEYIRQKNLKEPVIIGHSLGGYIALDLATHAPDLVGGTVVVDAYPFFAAVMQPGTTPEQAQANAAMVRQQITSGSLEEYQRQVRAGSYTRMMVTGEDDFKRITEWGLASDRVASAQAMSEMFSIDLRPRLEKLRAPAYVMLSYVAYAPFIDHARCEATGRDQYAHARNIRIDVSDTARHFIMLDDPEWFHSRIDNFLSSLK